MRTLHMLGASLMLASTAWTSPALAQIGGILPTAEEPPTRQGTRGANFLHIGISARGNAMAGAIGSSVRGPVSWFWNPSGAVSSEGFSAAAGLQNLYDEFDIMQAYAAVSLPVLGGVAGLSLNTLSSGDLDRTTEVFPFGSQGAGRTFRWNSTAASLGYARRLTDRLGVGGAIKYITEGIPDANTSWVAFDIGTQFHTGIYGMVLSGALQHMGGSARVQGAAITQTINDANVNRQATRTDLFTIKTELPTDFRFGLGNDLYGGAESVLGGGGGPHRLFAEVAVNDAVDQAAQLAVGAEYAFRNLFFARAGKRFYNDGRATGSNATYGLAGGFGVRIPVYGRDVRFDYSYTSLGDLQNIQVFSFEFGR